MHWERSKIVSTPVPLVSTPVPLVAFVLLTLTPCAQAASFDCAKAGTKVEHIICDSPEMSKLDEELAQSYKVVLQDQTKADAIKQAQKQWMKERNNCLDVACVKLAYEKRLAVLEENKKQASSNQTGNAEHYPQRPTKLRYAFCDKSKPGLYCEGQTGKGYTVCEVYLKHLQTLTTPPTCEAPMPPGFSLPNWEEMDVTKNLDLAFQAEGLFLKKFGGYKHPEFAAWKTTFLQEIQEGKINPRMRKAKVTPNDKGDAIILAYTRDREACHKSFACETKRKAQLDQLPSDMPAWRKAKMFPACPDPYWSSQGDVHFMLWEDLPEKLQEIGGYASGDQRDMMIYAGKAYLIQILEPLAPIYHGIGSNSNTANTSAVIVYSFNPHFPDTRPNLDLNHYVTGARCQLMPY